MGYVGTTNYGFQKPERSNSFTVDDMNNGFDKIDETIKAVDDNQNSKNASQDEKIATIEAKQNEQGSAIENNKINQLVISDGEVTNSIKITAKTSGGDVISNEYNLPKFNLVMSSECTPNSISCLGTVKVTINKSTGTHKDYIKKLVGSSFFAQGENVVTLFRKDGELSLTNIWSNFSESFTSQGWGNISENTEITLNNTYKNSSYFSPGIYTADAFIAGGFDECSSNHPVKIKIEAGSDYRVSSATIVDGVQVYPNYYDATITVYIAIDFTTLKKIS